MIKQKPMGLSLIICDTIIEDKLTGKKSIIGMFDRLTASKFPCLHPQLSILVSLTSGYGNYDCEILCTSKTGVSTVFGAKGKIALNDPSQVVDIAFNFKSIRFPKIGDYWLQFLVDDEPVMMRTLFIKNPEIGRQI